MSKPYVLGIDIGGTNTVFGIVDARGAVIASSSIKTLKHSDVNDYINELYEEVTRLLVANDAVDKIHGIGVGAPNANYYTGMIERLVNIPWPTPLPMAQLLSDKFGVPVAITNDANAAAIGEMIYGGARGMRDFIEITLGTGLGGGIVANGEMVYGYGGTAGELGHITVRPGGRLCGCGRRGCLETYVSATGIVRTMLEILADDTRPSRLRSVPVEKIDSKMIAEAALDGDELARAAFEETGRILGESLANFVAFSFPEAIFLFGGLAKSGNLLWEPTKRHMETNMLRNYKGMVKLLPSGIDRANAAILGASALVWKELRKLERR